MPKYYLIFNNNLVGEIDGDSPALIALPLLRSTDSMSLINQTHVTNLMTNLSLTAAQVLAALGLSDMRAALISTIFVAPQIVSLNTPIAGPAAKLIDIGAYSLYQVKSNQANLLALHAELWAMTPTQTLGMLAVVNVFGTSFYTTAMRTAVGMTAPQALTRRNLIATYLDGLGKNTTALRAATDENTQMVAIVTALGYTMPQLWAAMTA